MLIRIAKPRNIALSIRIRVGGTDHFGIVPLDE
jgi:hypothetical protein